MERLGLRYDLLGVDVVANRRLVARDANEAALLRLLAREEQGRAKIIVSPLPSQAALIARPRRA